MQRARESTQQERESLERQIAKYFKGWTEDRLARASGLQREPEAGHELLLNGRPVARGWGARGPAVVGKTQKPKPLDIEKPLHTFTLQLTQPTQQQN